MWFGDQSYGLVFVFLSLDPTTHCTENLSCLCAATLVVQTYRDRTSSVSGGSPGGFGDGLNPLNHANRALSKAHGSPDTLILQLLWGPNLLTYPGEAHGGGRKLIPAAWLCPGSIWGPFRNEGFLVHPFVWVTVSRGVIWGGGVQDAQGHQIPVAFSDL